MLAPGVGPVMVAIVVKNFIQNNVTTKNNLTGEQKGENEL
jgi:hypothetical protein